MKKTETHEAGSQKSTWPLLLTVVTNYTFVFTRFSFISPEQRGWIVSGDKKKLKSLIGSHNIYQYFGYLLLFFSCWIHQKHASRYVISEWWICNNPKHISGNIFTFHVMQLTFHQNNLNHYITMSAILVNIMRTNQTFNFLFISTSNPASLFRRKASKN